MTERFEQTEPFYRIEDRRGSLSKESGVMMNYFFREDFTILSLLNVRKSEIAFSDDTADLADI